MFWIWTAVVVVAVCALAWFVSGREQKRFGDPGTAKGGTGMGDAAVRDVLRNSTDGNGPARL